MTSGDWLPAQAPFDLVRRGYSPEQVTAHLERLEYDLRIATANRDATTQRLSELGIQLATAQAEADTLRAQLDRTALEPVSMSGLSDRMQRMIRLAEEEASDIRARAQTEADRLRSQLETAVAEAEQARSNFDSERERTRKQLAEQVHGLIAEATGEAEDTRSQAQEESSRLLQEANAEADRTVTEARRHAEQIVAEATQAAELQRTESEQEADRVLGAARETIMKLTAESTAERERLDAEFVAYRTQSKDDFDIAVKARRAEIMSDITERDASSKARAEKLIGDATAQAQRMVADATAESELLMQRATTYSNALVNRATVDSNHRVADADHAVGVLQEVRGRIVDQLQSLAGHLDHIRDLVGSAPGVVAPPTLEADRPRAQDFPADPSLRPTQGLPPVPVLDTSIASIASIAGADGEHQPEVAGRTDQGGDHDGAGETQQGGDFSDAADQPANTDAATAQLSRAHLFGQGPPGFPFESASPADGVSMIKAQVADPAGPAANDELVDANGDANWVDTYGIDAGTESRTSPIGRLRTFGPGRNRR